MLRLTWHDISAITGITSTQHLIDYARQLEAENLQLKQEKHIPEVIEWTWHKNRIAELEAALTPFVNVVDGVYALPPGKAWESAARVLRGTRG